jgi:tetratricopeptide (TPR) repeat protein
MNDGIVASTGIAGSMKTADDMRIKTITTAATLALTLTWQTAAADKPSATDRCMELLQNADDIADEVVAVCAVAAEESREGLVLYGDILSSQENVEGAIEHYSKALEGIDPNEYDGTALGALRRRAVEYYHVDYEAAAFKDAVAYLDHEPDDTDMLFIAGATASSPQTGLTFVERLVKVQPEDVLNHSLHARLLLAAGKQKEALAVADRAIKNAPKNPDALAIKANLYASMGEHAKAERLFAQVVKASPKDPRPKVSRADSLIELRRYEEAIAVATAALEDQPNYFYALHSRATAYLTMGDGNAALADIKLAKEVEPRWDSSEAQARAEKLIEIYQTLSPAGIAQIEADRTLTLRGITRHLHSQCSNYRLPRFSPDLDTEAVNADLNRYRDCLRQWVSIPEIEIYDSLTPAEIAAGERLYDAKNIVAHDAEALRCSNMPKRSKCIPDAAFTKVEPLMAGAEDPFTWVRNFEIERLNNDLAALSKAIDSHNRGVAIADFVNSLAEALNEP